MGQFISINAILKHHLPVGTTDRVESEILRHLQAYLGGENIGGINPAKPIHGRDVVKSTPIARPEGWEDIWPQLKARLESVDGIARVEWTKVPM
jgi:hypothetical protein